LKTLVLGASSNPDRYSYKAILSLTKHHHSVVAIGAKNDAINDIPIYKEYDWNTLNDIDTVTLYLNPTRQEDFMNRIIALQPRRVIFNPGTENEEFQDQLIKNGIIAQEACTLVLLSVGNY
jgi:uncharacterized protein